MSLWRQSAWYALGNLWAAVLQLLISALLIRQLGIVAFGEWLLAWTVVMLCSLASSGIGPVMSLRLQSADKALHRASVLRDASESTLLLATILCFPAITWLEHARGATPALSGGTWWWLLVPCQVLANEAVALSAAALRSLGDYRTGALSQMVARTLWTLGLLAMAHHAPRLDAMLFVTATCTIGQALWQFWRLQLAGLTLTRAPGAPPRRWAALFDLARWQWLKAVSEMLYLLADRLLINAFLGPAMLAVYVVCLQLTEPLSRIAGLLSQPLLLWAGRLRDGLHAASEGLVVVFALQLFVLLAGLALCIAGPRLLPLWLPGSENQYAAALLVAVMAATLTSLHAVANELQTGLGMLRRLAWTNFAGALLALTAMGFAVHQGLEQVMLARCLFGLCLAMTWPALWRRLRTPTHALAPVSSPVKRALHK